MNIEELAKKLNGREIGNEITKEETEEARKSGLVVVYGASDDLMEFVGALTEEEDVFDGGSVKVTKEGVLHPPHTFCATCQYFRPIYEAAKEIEAVWNDSGISWSYKTDIPHVPFYVMEEGEVYCRGIVFSVKDL